MYVRGQRWHAQTGSFPPVSHTLCSETSHGPVRLSRGGTREGALLTRLWRSRTPSFGTVGPLTVSGTDTVAQLTEKGLFGIWRLVNPKDGTLFAQKGSFRSFRFFELPT